MPISPEQLAANRANAAKSTGPKTPEGKARSAQNSTKHGFAASAFAVVRLEDLDEVAHLKADLVSVYQPANSQELFALERMALSQQAILRAARLESGLFTTCLNEALDANDRPFTPMSKELAGDGDIEITRTQNRNYCLADGFLRQARQSNGWSLFLRYQAQAERQYRRALEEFDRLKALRPLLPDQAMPDEPISDPQPERESAAYPNPEPNLPRPSEAHPSTPQPEQSTPSSTSSTFRNNSQTPPPAAPSPLFAGPQIPERPADRNRKAPEAA